MPAISIPRFMTLVVVLLCTHLHLAQAADAVLEVRVGKQQQTLALTDLLKHPALRTISIPADVSYKKPMQYRALPLTVDTARYQPGRYPAIQGGGWFRGVVQKRREETPGSRETRKPGCISIKESGSGKKRRSGSYTPGSAGKFVPYRPIR